MTRTRAVCRSLALCLAVFLADRPAAAGDGRVRQKQSITELLEGPATSLAVVRRDGDARSDGVPLGWKLGSAGIGCALLVVCAVILKRRRARGAMPNEAGVVQVVGRALLSHRHAIFVVQVSGRRLVVGVSGDRMTALDAFEPAAPAAGVDAVLVPAAPEPPRGYSVRPEDREELLARRQLDASELRPYRKQMDRLRGMLREIRGDGPGEGMDGS